MSLAHATGLAATRRAAPDARRRPASPVGGAGCRPAAELRDRPGFTARVPEHPRAFTVLGPASTVSPLVFDSPHSWRHWPAEATATLATPAQLDACWDAWVNEIWAEAIDGAAPLLAARFHQAYIDANRSRHDIDPALLTEPWPGPTDPQATSHRGVGLVRRDVVPGVPMYRQPLQVDDVRQRIQRCYDPYHACLAELLDQAHAAHGFCLHVTCHSMRSAADAASDAAGAARPDIAVSDLDGRSASPVLVRWVADALRDLGYSVRINAPCRGAELVRRHGRPADGRHSIQITVKRSLYMHESCCERHAGFDPLIVDLGHVVRRLRTALCGSLGAHLQPHPSFPHHKE